MKQLRAVFTLAFVIAVIVAATKVAHGTVGSSFEERMKNLEQSFTTPPSVSLDQRSLQIATIAAAQSQSTDPELIMNAFRSAGSMVTYYLHSDTSYTWTGAAWDLDGRTTYSYTSGNLTETVYENWVDDHWEYVERTVQTYNGSNRLLTTLSQTWDTDHWVNGSLFSFTYNGGGLVTEFLMQLWQTGAWVNYSKYISAYSGNKMTTQTSQMWSGTEWVNQARNVFTYNGSDQVTEMLNQGWGDPLWYDNQRVTSTYTSGNLTLSLTESHDVDGWYNIRKTEYAYNGSNQEILDAFFSWSTITNWTITHSDTSRYSGANQIENVLVLYQSGTPIYKSRDLFTYDGAGNMTQDLSQSDAVGTWLNSYRTTFYYSTSGIFGDDAAGVPAGFGVGQNYPNPFNSSTLIPYGLESDGQVRITVANILGQSVAELVNSFQPAGSYSAVWDGRNANGVSVSSGIYFFRVQVGGQSQVRKMVLLK